MVETLLTVSPTASIETHPDAPDRDVAGFAHEFVSKHQLITNDERAWAPQVVKEVELWIGTSVEQASAKHLSKKQRLSGVSKFAPIAGAIGML